MTNLLKPLKPIEINFELDLVKQNRKEVMKKLALVISILSILASSANAGYWSHTPQIGGGTSTYNPSTTDILRQYNIW